MSKIRRFKQKDKDSVIALWKDIFSTQKPHNDPELVINLKVVFNDGLFLWLVKIKKLMGQ